MKKKLKYCISIYLINKNKNKTKQQELLRPKRAMLFEILRKIKHPKTCKNKKEQIQSRNLI